MKKINLLIVLLIAIAHGHAQDGQRIIRGVVSESSSLTPLEGVEIFAKISRLASGSQTDGIFTIPVTDKDSILVFRFAGYQTKEIRLKGNDEINIQLSPSRPLSLYEITGKWRGTFAIRNGLEAPFNFEITANDNTGSVSLINASEKFPAGNITITGDSVFVSLPLFENELAFVFDNNTLKGVLRRHDLRGSTTPVTAQKGIDYRFEETGTAPVKNISGNYRVTFQSANGKEEQAVGIFKQQGKHVTATFLRITGDTRYLDGDIEGNEIRLSSFIGSSPAYYKAVVNNDNSLSGESIAARGSLPFTAIPDANAELPDAYKLTSLKEGTHTFSFSFPDAEGKMISSTDAKFAGKPLIIAIGGTWCPNCMDEAGFLSPWYKKNKDRGIEVIALQYERQTDLPYVKKAFERFRNHFDIGYTMLLGGTADKQVVVNTLPALQNFISFPTTIFIDRTGNVQKIHTGFTGPATGDHYTAFIKEFNEEADKLIRP